MRISDWSSDVCSSDLFNWETAALYSQATVRDVQDGISATLLQQNLALSTPDAYNPFSGGNPDDPTGLPISAGNLDAGEDFRIKTVRRGKSTLAQWDIRASKADLLTGPASTEETRAG